jgi:hypothetical protein
MVAESLASRELNQIPDRLNDQLRLIDLNEVAALVGHPKLALRRAHRKVLLEFPPDTPESGVLLCIQPGYGRSRLSLCDHDQGRIRMPIEPPALRKEEIVTTSAWRGAFGSTSCRRHICSSWDESRNKNPATSRGNLVA